MEAVKECTELAEEVRGGAEAAPAPADQGSVGEGGGSRSEAAEYHRKEVTTIQQHR